MKKVWDDTNAVSAVIGTIMALMVILAFMSMIILYWIPAAMEENEAQHMKEVSNQFSQFKETQDDMIRDDYRNTSVDSTFKLGSDGVPPFARETSGQLSLKLYDELFNVSFEDSGESIQEGSSGSLELAGYNRYYVPQTLIYEQGSIILYQSAGAIVKTEPQLEVMKENSGDNNLTIDLMLISLHHTKSQSIQGTGSVTVKTRLWYTESWIYNNITTQFRRITITITSKHAESAWKSYFEDALPRYNLKEGVDYNLTITAPRTLEVTFDRANCLTLTRAYFEADIG